MPGDPPTFGTAPQDGIDLTDARAHHYARRLYDDDHTASGLGIELEAAGVGRATTRMTVREDMLNGAGKCHGGVIFTLADTAFQCACNSYGRPTVSAASSIQFVRPASPGDELVAVCVERYRNRSTGGYDVTVTAAGPGAAPDARQLVALFRGQAHELRSAAR